MAWMVMGIGCTPAIVPLLFMSSGSVHHCDETICDATTGGARQRCLAAYDCGQELEANQADEATRAHDNAAIRETGYRLRRERELEESSDAARCRRATSKAQADPSAPATIEMTVEPGPGQAALPEVLDPAMISEAVAKVKTRVMACRGYSSVAGQIVLSVEVGPDGCVAAVSVERASNATIGTCVATAIQSATFVRTEHGGSFRYPFAF